VGRTTKKYYRNSQKTKTEINTTYAWKKNQKKEVVFVKAEKKMPKKARNANVKSLKHMLTIWKMKMKMKMKL